MIAPAHLSKLSRADARDYSAQFAMRLMNKDFRLVLETAAAAKVPMPATEAAFQMNAAEFNEGKEEDFSAVIVLMERLAHLETSDAGSRRAAGSAWSQSSSLSLPMRIGVEGGRHSPSEDDSDLGVESHITFH